MKLRSMKWKNKTNTPTYNSWKSMRNRVLSDSCDNHKFYKDKGIKICDGWSDNYDKFYEDMGERPFGTTLDRIDSDGNYEKSNCRWASHRIQQNNKDSLSKIERNGVIKTIGEWAFELELSHTETVRAYKRYTNYGAKEFDEIFCDHLSEYRMKNRVNKCLVCDRSESIKWRKKGRLCNTCYHQALRLSKKTGENINEVKIMLIFK